MSDIHVDRELPAALRWWNVPINWDPVPDWLFDRLNVELLGELLVADIEFQREVLKQQVGQLDRKLEILQRGLGK